MQSGLELALNRIAILEAQVEAMRQNINVNLNGHTDIFAVLIKHTECHTPIRLLHVDVGQR